jgi:plasmid stability protein
MDENHHRALRLKAAETDRSISDLVNDAVRAMLREDTEDTATVRGRECEELIGFKTFVADLKRRGLL